MDTFLQQKPEITGLDLRHDLIVGMVLTLRFQDRHLICLGVQDLTLLAHPLVLPVKPLLLIYPQHHDDPDQMLYTIKDNQEKFIRLYCQSYEWTDAVL